MLAECLGTAFNAMQALAGDRFLPLLDAFQGDDVMMPTVEQVERRIVMVKLVSEFKGLQADGRSDVDILDEMARKHNTAPATVKEILLLAAEELATAESEHAFVIG